MGAHMKLVCFADTHALDLSDVIIPDGDVLICAGDFTNIGEIKDVIKFNTWLNTLPHEHKIIIAGNHDHSFCEQDGRQGTDGAEYLTNCNYLQDSEVVIDGVKFYGSPATKKFCNWAHNYTEKELKEKWKAIPDDTDVLITHGPAHGFLDKCVDGYRAGCKHLATRIRELDLKYHVCGHIHESYGRQGIHINCSLVNEYYEIVNKPIVVDL
tara:strand:+ start:148 stop:780 length:633 start_codon:yes stop_codon:yes gene_type:complete